jgi:hypothetical protein
MTENGVEIDKENLPERFAHHFDKKIKDVVSRSRSMKMFSTEIRSWNVKFSISWASIMFSPALNPLKNKNSEGFDRISQQIIVDGADALINSLAVLFEKIYLQRTVPDQWLVSKTIPVYKNKGDVKSINKYILITNLCSASKIFEKLILTRISETQETK